MPKLNYMSIWEGVVQNQNKWVLFEHGTVVIFLPKEISPETDMRAEAIRRLKKLKILKVAVAELIGQGEGWIVNCGDDYILNYLPHGEYASRYDRIAAMIETQKQDQSELKTIHVQR